MTDEGSRTPEGVLMDEMGITEQSIDRRARFVALDSVDIERLKALRPILAPHVDRYAGAFFDHLSTLEEARPLFANKILLDLARRLKSDHLVAMVEGEYRRAYVEQRIKLGILYG